MAVKIGNSGITAGYVGNSAVTALYKGNTLVWTAQTAETYTYVTYISGGTGATITLPIDPADLTDPFEIIVKGAVRESDFYRNVNISNFFELNPAEMASLGVTRAGGNLKITWWGGADDVSYSGLPSSAQTVITWAVGDSGIYDITNEYYVASGSGLTTEYDNGTFDVLVNGFLWHELVVDVNGVIVFDGKAATRDSDSQGGLYDTVSQQFYTDPNNTITSAS